MKRALLLVATVLGGLACASAAFAQSDDDRLRQQLRATVLQLRDLQDAQASLQARAQAAEQERDALRAQLAKLQGTAKSAEAGRAQFAQSAAKYQSAYSEAATQAQKNEAACAQMEAQFSSTNASLQVCTEKNAQLIALSREILAAYEDFGIGDAIAASEPFVRQKRVDLENAAQGYDDRVYDGRFDPTGAKPTPKP